MRGVACILSLMTGYLPRNPYAHTLIFSMVGRYLGKTLGADSLALTPTTSHHLQLCPFLLTNSLTLDHARPSNLAVQSSATATCNGI